MFVSIRINILQGAEAEGSSFALEEGSSYQNGRK